ncbi:MAG: ABC transporter ATP-binding protein, partial [Rhodospirillales bacterium]|nr:ABC transporter ATP-binding protein [Rhodospirillales bacterium]
AVMLVSHDRDFIDRVVTSVIAWEGDGRWVEYAGGYSDIKAQRRQNAVDKGEAKDKAAKKPASNAASSWTSSPPPSPTKRKGKLTFKDTHALKTLPGKMATLQGEIDARRKTLTDPNLYASDAEAFNTAAAELEVAESQLAALEEEWLALEMAREEVEGG